MATSGLPTCSLVTCHKKLALSGVKFIISGNVVPWRSSLARFTLAPWCKKGSQRSYGYVARMRRNRDRFRLSCRAQKDKSPLMRALFGANRRRQCVDESALTSNRPEVGTSDYVERIFTNQGRIFDDPGGPRYNVAPGTRPITLHRPSRGVKN